MDVPPRAAPPPALLVTGMHRSGTSLLTSILAAAGVHVGDQLMGAAESNPHGHFEDLEFYALHQRVLAANGLSREGFTCQATIDVPASARAEAMALVGRRRAAGRLWGWKDPRSTLFLDLWAELLPEARYVFAFRPVWEVVDSLFRRGDDPFVLNPRFAIELWVAYNKRILEFVRSHPGRCLLLETRRVAGDPALVVERVAALCGATLGTPVDRYDPTLLVSEPSPHRAVLVQGLCPEAMQLLDELRRAAGEPSPPFAATRRAESPAEAGLAEWLRSAASQRAAVAECRGALEQVARLRDGLTEADARLAAERAATLELSTRIAAADEEHAALHALLDAERRHGDEMAVAQGLEREALTAAHDAERPELDSRLRALVAEHDSQRRSLDARLEALSAALADRDAALAARDADLAARDAALALRDADLADRAITLAAREAECRQLEAALSARDAECRRSEAALAALRRDLAARDMRHERDLEALAGALDAERRAMTLRLDDAARALDASTAAAEDDRQRAATLAAEVERLRGDLAAGTAAHDAATAARREADALATQLRAERETFEALRQDMVVRLDAALAGPVAA
ncbi:MAG: sulfotransferase [Planctomycetaceae bacterium]